MSEPRRPLLGFLWPRPDPDAPVDAAYRQRRRVRVTGRGPFRLLLLVVGTVAEVAVAGTVVSAAVTSGATLAAALGALAAATGLVLVLRGWVVGTYVTDAAVTVETTWRRTVVAWPQVAEVTCGPARSPLLGLPVRVAATRCAVVTRDGRVVPTHVYSCSPDLWGRAEAFDIAASRLQTWLGEAGQAPS